MKRCIQDHAALVALKSDPAWLRANSTPHGLMVDLVDDEQPSRVDTYEHRNHACLCGTIFTWCLLVSSVEVSA